VVEERQQPVEVWVAELPDGPLGEAGEPRRLELPGSASELRWSPRGDRLALALAPTPSIDDEYMQRRVKIVDPADGAVVASVDNPGKLGEVAWSPDGTRLAMISAADLNDPREGRLVVVDAAGGAPRDLVPGLPGHVTDFAWLGSEALLYLADRGLDSSLERVAVGGGDPAVLSPDDPLVWEAISVSADGRRAALLADSPAHPSELFDLRLGDGGAVAGVDRVTRSNPWLDGVRLARQEAVTFTARDGLELQGILIRPLDERPGTRYPLILTVHGGPESHYRNGWLTGYALPGQMAAGRGYAVFYPNYRGSTGRGVEFSKTSQADPAGAEFDDLVDAVDHLVASGLADRDKVGITGGSYGGYATAWASTRFTDRFAAGVMFVGISELISKIGTSDIPNELYAVHERLWPWEDWELMLQRSPAHYVEQARTPLLILGGDADPRVHPSQSLTLFRYLKVLGKTPVRLVQYPGEEHGNRRAAARLDYSLRMMRWFDHYLKGPGGDPPPPDLEYRRPEEEESDE
jgi:dipeptidyl aminopeptidase/acylaminoacyl peptidase